MKGYDVRRRQAVDTFVQGKSAQALHVTLKAFTDLG